MRAKRAPLPPEEVVHVDVNNMREPAGVIAVGTMVVRELELNRKAAVFISPNGKLTLAGAEGVKLNIIQAFAHLSEDDMIRHMLDLGYEKEYIAKIIADRGISTS